MGHCETTGYCNDLRIRGLGFEPLNDMGTVGIETPDKLEFLVFSTQHDTESLG